MTRQWMTAMLAVAAVSVPTPAAAQWNGLYLGGFGGWMLQNGDHDETVTFDTNLDEEFVDTVRTITGADHFAPGFCAGAALGTTPAASCEDDNSGLLLGARVGYDFSLGRVVLGVVGDVAKKEAIDSVSAYSTTPAFYTFTRELHTVAGLRGRIGVGNDYLMAYGTGGLALGWIEHRFITSNTVNRFLHVGGDPGDDDDLAVSDEGDDVAWGYSLGAGAEFWIADGVALTAEYLFTSLSDGDDGIVRAQGPAPPGNPFLIVNSGGTDMRRSDGFAVHAITVGVVYRF